MSRINIKKPSEAQEIMDRLYLDAERKIAGMPPGLCPVDVALSFLRLSHTQSCGKCVPCRIGLGQLANLMEDVLNGRAGAKALSILKETAQAIIDSADCAIGREGAAMVLRSLEAFKEDYEEHVKHNRCISHHQYPVPCVSRCPAGVDIPGYIALIHEGHLDDAIRLMKKDNPLPVSCAYICEHPCELRCRRKQIDAPVNIRELKRYAVDNAGSVNNPAPEEDTGKKVAIIGGGPSGLAAAYYLRLMGHSVSIFDRKNKLGGMLRYGIPSYRFPREQLDKEIESILELGIDIHTDCAVGKDITLAKLNREYDAIYIAIGAQTDNKLGIPGENAKKVVSAVSVLRGIGDGIYPDFANKRIVVVGGGNVAMDATRTALRLGASKVTTVYRRRIEDMTALPEEVDGALKEGAEILSLMAPIKIQTGKDGAAVSLIAQPQIPGEIDKAGRPRPIKADAEPVEIPADVIIMAVGQAIESDDFANAGVPVEKSKILAGLDCRVKDKKKLFAGGDGVTGPSTAIEAIAAGKVAAAQIDEYLGYAHSISTDIEIPEPRLRDFVPAGRINSSEREAGERAHDFCDVAHCMSKEEAERESARCLRCDHFGYGSFRGGRTTKW